MVSFELIVAFASAARHGGFTGAARALGLSPSAVAKNVARLESELGVRLFHRTTRRVTLTQEGENLYARCERIVDDVESLQTASITTGAAPGTLRIDLPLTYGREIVLPIVLRLLARHPGLKLDVRFSDHVTDLVKEGVDAAVRIGQPSDSRLVARMFDQQAIWTCASPAYLASHGTPATPQALATHHCVLFRMPASGRDRAWEFRTGKRAITLHPEGSIRLGDGEALVHAALAGLGLIQVPSYMAEAEVRRGRLVEVLKQYRPAPLPISLVYAGRRHMPSRVRLLAEALLERRAARVSAG